MKNWKELKKQFWAKLIAMLLAIVSVTSLTTGMTTDVNSYMFGSILAMTKDDVILCVLLS